MGPRDAALESLAARQLAGRFAGSHGGGDKGWALTGLLQKEGGE